MPGEGRAGWGHPSDVIILHGLPIDITVVDEDGHDPLEHPFPDLAQL